jgi:hypothetical protein
MFKIKKRYCSIGIYLHIKENFNPNNFSKWSDVPDHNDGVKLQTRKKYQEWYELAIKHYLIVV